MFEISLELLSESQSHPVFHNDIVIRRFELKAFETHLTLSCSNTLGPDQAPCNSTFAAVPGCPLE